MKLDKKYYKEFTARNALYVENITDVAGEEEVIFPSGSQFYLDDVKDN